MIGFCDPPLSLADNLLSRALDLPFKSKNWHFCTTSVHWLATPNSKTIGSLMKEKPKFTFALQVIVMIVIITLKNAPNGSILMRKQVFFIFPKQNFWKTCKKTTMLLTEQMLKRSHDTIVRWLVCIFFKNCPRGIFKGTPFHGVSAGWFYVKKQELNT